MMQAVALASAATVLQLASSVPVRMSQCSHDEAIFKMSSDRLDQDMASGWRRIASEPGCKLPAANVIRIYRTQMAARIRTMWWHEGQLHAVEGGTRVAIRLMKKLRVPRSQKVLSVNLYVNATVAFLKKNRLAFLIARDRLSGMPEPDDWDQEWPPNGRVITTFGLCFNGACQAAYEQACKIRSAKSFVVVSGRAIEQKLINTRDALAKTSSSAFADRQIFSFRKPLHAFARLLPLEFHDRRRCGRATANVCDGSRIYSGHAPTKSVDSSASRPRGSHSEMDRSAALLVC